MQQVRHRMAINWQWQAQGTTLLVGSSQVADTGCSRGAPFDEECHGKEGEGKRSEGRSRQRESLDRKASGV